MDVKAGYKQTEVGVIPEDWEVKALGEIFEFSGGLPASRDKLGEYGHFYLHYGDIHTSSRSHVDVDAQRTSLPKLDIPLREVQKKSLLLDGDVVFVDASEDDEGASKHHVVRNPRGVPFISGLHTIVAKSKSGDLSTNYKCHCFQTRWVKSQFLFYSVGTKVTGISKSNIAKILLPVPPLPEQEGIAKALSDADSLIESLEKLVAKKHLLKHGIINELLTGKKRLPGFSQEWEQNQLRRFVRNFIVPMRDKPKTLTGDIPWCRIEDFDGVYLLGSKSGQGVDVQTVRTMNLKVYPSGTLLVSCSADLGRCAIVAHPLVSNQTFIGLEMDESVSSNIFFYYYMTAKAEELNTLSSGTTISYLSRQQFEEFGVLVPADKEEQAAIAALLFDIDSELVMLETKLAKARGLKQGMMQELLTGRIRLV